MAHDNPALEYVEEELRKQEQLKPERLMEEIKREKANNLILSGQIAKLVKAQRKAEEEIPLVSAINGLVVQVKELKTAVSRLQDDKIDAVSEREKDREQADNLAQLTRILGDTITAVDERVIQLQETNNQFQKRVFGTGFEWEKKLRFEKSQKLTDYKPLGRYRPLSYFKATMTPRGGYVYSVYRDEVGPSEFATISVDDLSIVQRLNLLHHPALDERELVPPTQTGGSAPSKELENQAKRLSRNDH